MKIVCEMSGGADSALAAILAREKWLGADFYCLFVNYGQKYWSQEQQASFHLTKRIFKSVSWKQVIVQELYERYLPSKEEPPEYFPLRNLVIGAISGAYAAEIGAEVIVTGSKSFSKNELDPYSFNDSTLGFYKVLEAAINAAQEPHHPKVRVEPLLAQNRETKMTKYQVYKELMIFGISPSDTWSCYHPTVDGTPCKECKNCKEKEIFGTL